MHEEKHSKDLDGVLLGTLKGMLSKVLSWIGMRIYHICYLLILRFHRRLDITTRELGHETSMDFP